MNENNHDESSSSVDENFLFYCRCESTRSVSTLLSCLRQFVGNSLFIPTNNTQHNEGSQSLSVMVDHLSSADGRIKKGSAGRSIQQATVYAHPGGLTFHVHGIGRQSQASVDMQCGLFSDYHVSTETIPTGRIDENGNEVYESIVGGEFCVNLPTLIDSLHVLGLHNLDRTKVCMSYNRTAAILKVELEDRGVLATAAICGSVPEFEYDDNDYGDKIPQQDGIATSSLAVAFRNHSVVARAILKSDFFRSAVAELADIPGAMTCTIGIAPEYIEIGTVGHSGECLVHLPKSSETFASLECNPPILHARSYHLYSLLQGMRGLDIAQETCMSINANGMIAIQHQVLDVIGSSEANFIDFLMSAIQEDDDDNTQSQHSDIENTMDAANSSINQFTSGPRGKQVNGWNRKHRKRNNDASDGSDSEKNYDGDETQTARSSRHPMLVDTDLEESHLQVVSGRRTRSSSSPVAGTASPSTLSIIRTVHADAAGSRKKNRSSRKHDESAKHQTTTKPIASPPHRRNRIERSENLERSQSPELLFGETRLVPDNDITPARFFLGRSLGRTTFDSETEEEEFD